MQDKFFPLEDVSKFLANIDGGIVKLRYKKNFIIEYGDRKFYSTLDGIDDYKHFDDCLTEESLEKFVLNLESCQTGCLCEDLELRSGYYIQLRATINRVEDDIFLFCIILRDTKKVKYMQEIEIEQERYKVIMSLIDDVILGLDSNGNVEYCSKQFYTKFGSRPINENILKFLRNHSLIFKDDIEGFENAYTMVQHGVSECSTEIRIKTSSNKFIWCEVILNGIKDENEEVHKIMIIIKDINKERILRNSLLHRIHRDGLTNLYNKKSGLEMIDTTIKCGIQQGVLLFFDVDNFKGINDTYGHVVGDMVLKSIADYMREIFRSEDIMCRFGGDEYCIFAPEMSLDTARKKVEHLQLLIRGIQFEEAEDIKVTISVGITNYIRDIDMTASRLIEIADKALYMTKENGKDSYEIINNE